MINVKKLFNKGERGTGKKKVPVKRKSGTTMEYRRVGRKEDVGIGTGVGTMANREMNLIGEEIKRKEKIQNKLPKNSDEWNKIDKEIDKLIDKKTKIFTDSKKIN